MKRPRPRTRSFQPKRRADANACLDEALARCANIAAVAVLLQGHEAWMQRSAVDEDVTAASGRLLSQEVEKLHDLLQNLNVILPKLSQ